MQRITRVLVLFMVGLPGATLLAAESDAEKAWSFVTAIDARARYEYVDDDGFVQHANALTMRTRFSFLAQRSIFGVLAELEDVRATAGERYNSTANGNVTFPLVVDPEATELNRAWVRMTAPHSIDLKLGRQLVNRDGGRILGDVGWRQNQQTFDALSAERTTGRVRFYSAYLTRANRIFGAQHPNLVNRQFALDAFVGEGDYRTAAGTAQALVHYLEFENDPLRSHRNIGLAWLGRAKLDDGNSIRYRAQWIDQQPHADGAVTNEADYLALAVGYVAERWSAGANYEQLSGDGIYGFQRPLATLHAYNGWADRFLNTPAEGLTDLFVDAKVNVRGCTISAQLHRFDSDFGDLHFGDEIGVAVAHTFRERYSVALKFANHNADDVGDDVNKVWLQLRFAGKFKAN